MSQPNVARISDLMEELDALVLQLKPDAGGDTVKKLSLDVARARKELTKLDNGDAEVRIARLFDVAQQRIASVLQDHRMPAEDRKSLQTTAADLQAWRKELLNGSADD